MVNKDSHLIFQAKTLHEMFTTSVVMRVLLFSGDADVKRVLGNRKGLFTRQRQPKMAAYVVRQRYRNLSHQKILPLTH